MTSTEVMNLTRLPEDCSLEDIHYHLYVLIRIGTALAEGAVMDEQSPPCLSKTSRDKDWQSLQVSARKGGLVPFHCGGFYPAQQGIATHPPRGHSEASGGCSMILADAVPIDSRSRRGG